MLDQFPSKDSQSQSTLQSLQQMLMHKQMILSTRITNAQQTLHATADTLSRLQENEARATALETELQLVRESAKDLGVRNQKLEAENKAQRERIIFLEKAMQTSAAEALQLRKAILGVKKAAALKIGYVIKRWFWKSGQRR